MLVIFFGVSCVGKTTIIKHMAQKYGWRIFTTYMTRNRRLNESEKIQITHESMLELQSSNFFFCVNHLSSGLYGTPRSEVTNAETSLQEFWCLDFPIEKRFIFSDIVHCGIVIQPENIHQLKAQCIASGRGDRWTSIIEDLNKNYHLKVDRYCYLINKKNGLNSIGEQINAIALSRQNYQ